MGIKEGDVIGITSENCIEIPLIVFGAYFLGAAITTCNLTYTDTEMHHALNLSKPSIVFSSPYAVFNLEPVVKDCSFIKALIQFGEVPLLEGVLMFNDIISDASLTMPTNFVPTPVKKMEEQVAMIMLSSGTTGLPKGVEITQSNILAAYSMALYGISFNSSKLLILILSNFFSGNPRRDSTTRTKWSCSASFHGSTSTD